MDEEYRKIDKVNQSTLKQLIKSPQAYLRARDRVDDGVTPEHFIFGSLVDDMLLSPKIVDNKYYKMGESSASDAIKEIIRFVYDNAIINEVNGESFDNTELDKYILRGCIVYDWNARYGDDAKLKNIRKNGTEYYDSLLLAKGKTIVSESDYNQAIICVASLKSDPYTSQYFASTKDIEVIPRFIVEFEIDEVECKGELDKLFIHHGNKTIQPIDYKTTGKPLTGFQYDFWSYRYDFQGAFYTEGLKKNAYIKGLIVKGYTLLKFRYIVVEKAMTSPPMIYTLSKEACEIGKYGGTLTNGRVLEGVMDSLRRYMFHTTTDDWNYPMEYYKQNGQLYIEV